MLNQRHNHIADFPSIQTKEQWGGEGKVSFHLQKRNPLFFLSLTRTIRCSKAHNTPFNFSFLIRFFSFLPAFHLFSKSPAINILTSLPLYRYMWEQDEFRAQESAEKILEEGFWRSNFETYHLKLPAAYGF